MQARPSLAARLQMVLGQRRSPRRNQLRSDRSPFLKLNPVPHQLRPATSRCTRRGQAEKGSAPEPSSQVPAAVRHCRQTQLGEQGLHQEGWPLAAGLAGQQGRGRLARADPSSRPTTEDTQRLKATNSRPASGAQRRKSQQRRQQAALRTARAQVGTPSTWKSTGESPRPEEMPHAQDTGTERRFKHVMEKTSLTGRKTCLCS